MALWGILVAITLYLSLSNYQLYQFGAHVDDSRYLILGQSLLDSSQYGMINYPDETLPGKYPFGYPLLLVPSIAGFPGNFDALKFPSLFATLVNLSLIFWGWRYLSKTTSHWWGLGVAALYAFSPLTIDFSRQVMSEGFFTLFCLLAIVLTEEMVTRGPKRTLSLALGIVLVFAVFTRTIGVILVASVLVYLFITKGRTFWREIVLILVQAAVFLGVVVALTSVQMRDLLPLEYLNDENSRLFTISAAARGTTTLESKSEPIPSQAPSDWDQRWVAARDLAYLGITRHLGPDVRAIALPIGGGEQERQLFERLGVPALPMLIDYFVSFLVIVGILRAWVLETFSLFLLFAIAYFVALLFWFWKEPRFLYPIQPQIFFGLLMGLAGGIVWLVSKTVRQPSQRRIGNAAFLILVVIMAAGFVFKSTTLQDSRLHVGDIALRSGWLRPHSPPSAVILTEFPAPDYVYSGRKTVPYPPLPFSASEFKSYLIEHKITHILLAPPIKWQTSYEPYYSNETNEILPLLDELTINHAVAQVYDSGATLIRVYQVQPFKQ